MGISLAWTVQRASVEVARYAAHRALAGNHAAWLADRACSALVLRLMMSRQCSLTTCAIVAGSQPAARSIGS
jgi:hypothetical protein